MRTRLGRLAMASGLLGAACAPSTQPPVSVMAIVQGSDGNYAPTAVNLHTLRDIVAMKGDVTSILGSARVVVDQNDPALQTPGLTDQQVEAVFIKDRGQTPTGSYIQKGQTYWPADFHTWNMVTAYYGFEQAFNYFQARGVPSGLTTDASGNATCAPGSLCGATLYYWPTFTLVQSSPAPQQDNVLYYSPIQAFLLLPFDQQLSQVPLGMNTGVLTHEYSHRVFNLFVYQGELFPSPLGQWLGQGGSTPQINLLKAIDEGLADYHAYGASCSTPFGCTTRFLEPSFGATFADARDMSKGDKCMTTGEVNALCSLQAGDFINQGLQYTIGTNFAAALYHAGKNAGQEAVLEKAVIDSYSDTDPAHTGISQCLYQNLNSQGNVTLGGIVNLILLHITDPALQQEACNQFMDHLQLLKPDICPSAPQMPCGTQCGCPATSAGGTSCPNIFPGGSNTACPGF